MGEAVDERYSPARKVRKIKDLQHWTTTSVAQFVFGGNTEKRESSVLVQLLSLMISESSPLMLHKPMSKAVRNSAGEQKTPAEEFFDQVVYLMIAIISFYKIIEPHTLISVGALAGTGSSHGKVD